MSKRQLRSQQLRQVNHQGDALRMGMNWTEEDLGKPQILVESAYGMGHPGTFHFRPLIEEVSNGVFEAGGKPGVFYVSDICDGVAQAHSGMSYSLVSRDIQAAMIECAPMRMGNTSPRSTQENQTLAPAPSVTGNDRTRLARPARPDTVCDASAVTGNCGELGSPA